MASRSAQLESDHQPLQRLLPTCQRCRRLRRKCDTRLPSCQPCGKAGAECIFYDHALKQTLPRAYVQSLLTRVEDLQAAKNGASIFDAPSIPREQPASGLTHESPVKNVSDPRLLRSFDVIIPSVFNTSKSRFWGASSVFALTVEILHHAVSRGFIAVEDAVEDNSPGADHGDDQAPYTRIQAPDSDIQDLIHLYLVSLNTMYGFVDQGQASIDLQTYLALRQQPTVLPRELQGEQTHQYFRTTMMCAIACASQARHRPQRAAQSLAYYADALGCVEEVTSEVSPASLQALLLLIVFCLFYPRKGDIWKLLDYACRLTIELGYHTEEEHDQVVSPETQGETEAQRKLRRSSFWGLYAIERIVGQLFGRGSDLPETIITTEYPSSLHMGTVSSASPAAMPGVDQATLQSMSIAHHYRLVYLRSEIFRSMYLPASPPDLGLDWLKEKHGTLHAWRQELTVSDEMAGVATLTCDVGYDATMCFLFQPLLLRALRATAVGGDSQPNAEAGSPSETENIVVASDSFYSAINLIRTYEKIIRAPERSALGIYPMTFLSAHYIYLGTSTLLAQALLRLDGRVQNLKRMCTTEAASAEETEDLDWGAFLDISSSCLILLAWCGERWPGMLGMLGVYQRLFGRIVRELIGKGIIR